MNRTTELRYADTLQNLKGFDDWLRRLRVPLRLAGRAHHAIRVLEKAQRVFLEKTEQQVSPNRASYSA